MALFLPGPIVGDIRGSIGGTTFTRAPSGLVARSRRGPSQSTSNLRGIQRNIFASVSRQYRNMTLADQAAWRSFAQANPVLNRYNQPIILSGLSMFMYLNATNRRFVNASVGSPPADLTVSNIEAAGVTAVHGGVGNVTIHVDCPAATTDEWFVILLTGPLGKGRVSPAVGLTSLLVSQDFGIDVDVTAEWIARFGSLPAFAGNAIVMEAYVIRSTNGARSPKVKAFTRFT